MTISPICCPASRGATDSRSQKKPCLKADSTWTVVAAGVGAGLGQAAAGFVGNGLADFRRFREAGFDVHRLARSDAGQDAPLERRPEAIHLGRDVEGLVEDRRRVLHISVVDGDGNVGGWDRARVGARAKTAGALAHDLGEAVRRFFPARPESPPRRCPRPRVPRRSGRACRARSPLAPPGVLPVRVPQSSYSMSSKVGVSSPRTLTLGKTSARRRVARVAPA